ncbi:MAG TPA: helix-turn-helix transcriptional regulator [Terracidiphilus sp.]|nr:helix-turn-helix transcriptional regulator [Terracidiphilus sp.]
MPNAKSANKPAHVTAGNVMEDLGFSPEEIHETEIKHALWKPMRAAIEARKLTQAQVAKALGIHQPDASLLLRGQIARFSITRLMQFAERLQFTVRLTVVPTRSAAARSVRVKRRRTAAVA